MKESDEFKKDKGKEKCGTDPGKSSFSLLTLLLGFYIGLLRKIP